MGGPSPPKATPASTAPPKTEDKAVQDAAAEALRRRRTARGFRSTILSSMMEDKAPALKETLGT